jgi:hypothetical protein
MEGCSSSPNATSANERYLISSEVISRSYFDINRASNSRSCWGPDMKLGRSLLIGGSRDVCDLRELLPLRRNCLRLRFFWLFSFLLLCCCWSSAQQHPAGKQSILEVTQADAYARYRYIDNQVGAVTSDDLQYRFTMRPKVKIPRVGTYFGSRIETGSSFSSSWSNSGVGTSPKEWVLNAKTFFVGQRIGSRSEVDVGAMDVEQGAGTEATYTDLDAYTEGYRLRLHNLGGRYSPSKIVLHIGYLGDFNQVNAFSRLYRLGEVNYVQVLAEKSIEKWAVTSLQFDRLSGFNLLRGAVKFNLQGSYWINEARVEAVGRMNKDAAGGWALHLTKTKGRTGKFNPGVLLL